MPTYKKISDAYYPMAKKEAASAPALSAELLALIAERDGILQWLEPAKSRELELRQEIAAALFPNPEEGANRLFTEDGYEVFLDYKINRKLDEAALDTIMLSLPEESDARQPGVLINWKPTLVLTGYRNLPEDQLKIFQQALEEKPGTPTLDIRKVDPMTGQLGVVEPAAPDQQGTTAQSQATSIARREKIKKAAAKAPKKVKK